MLFLLQAVPGGVSTNTRTQGAGTVSTLEQQSAQGRVGFQQLWMDEMLENRPQAALGLAGKCCQGFYPASYPLISTNQHLQKPLPQEAALT